MRTTSSFVHASLLGFLFLMPAVAGAFSDLPATHANAEAVAYVQEKGMVQGYADGTFRADTTINRAEFTKIVVSAFSKAEGRNCFPDVRDEWFAPYVCAAKAKGIIAGYADGTFKPTQNVSFAEAAKIIAVAFGKDVSTSGSVWYEGYVRSLADANAIPVSIMNFGKNLSRGEMAEMIFRLDAKRTDKASSSYEKIAGLSERVQNQNTSSSSASFAQQDYPYTFPLTAAWKTDWNFYIDTKAPAVKEEEGVNLLATLDLDRVERTEEAGGQFGEFLRVNFPKGSGSAFNAHFYGKPKAGVVAVALGRMKPAESLHLTYYVRFPKDFVFTNEGTLPGLRGGTTTSEYGSLGANFAVFPYWTAKGDIGVGGNFDIATKTGEIITAGKFTADGAWHRIDLTANLNTVPVKRINGVLKMEYDGEVLLNIDNVRFRSGADDHWDSLAFYSTIGNYNVLNVSPKDMYVDLAGFTMAEE